MASDKEGNEQRKKRLTRIVTRGGDKGNTRLGDGSTRRKSDVRVEAIGQVDELNSCLGVLASQLRNDEIEALVQGFQNTLFDLGADLAVPGRGGLDPGAIQRLEAIAQDHNRELPELREFILPGGSEVAAFCHLARTMCRRAERAFVRLADSEPDVDGASVGIYLNRLSDVLFILARVLNAQDGASEILWQPKKD
ncbi:MAG: cob(I)yrinic acid a,c-diamide adenosyltransferase [Gammaproteobacteria bacterium]|nr:cob(I)yrinic acid a,c-diamide adenosyltransferase [Gammaproteobacteria bacterium]